MTKVIFGLSLAATLILAIGDHAFAAAPHALSIGGQLYLPNGSPVAQPNVNFRVEIYDAAESCVLYREDHLAEDLSHTAGSFNLILGTGSAAVNNLGMPNTLDPRVFANGGSTAVANCSSSTVALNSGDGRSIRIFYDLGSGLVPLTPSVPVLSSAYAMVAETLDGKRVTDFLQVNATGSSALSQANTEYAFSAVNWPRLKALLDGSSSQYLATSPSASINFNGQKGVNFADPTTAQDAATKNYVDTTIGGRPLDVSNVGPMTGNGLALTWDATANKWAAAAVNTSPTGTAGGALTGSYPNPTLANDVVSSAQIKSTGGGANRLLITDATTGATIGFGTCALNEVYAWTASGWACTAVATLSPVSSVAGKTGAVTLNAADVGGLGTVATRDYGTSSGQVPLLGAGGSLPALDGSQLQFVNATLLGGRAVASTAPTPSQVLGWNNVSSNWEPTSVAAGSSGTVTSVAGGVGLLGGPITSNGTLSVDVGNVAGKIVQENANAQIAQVDGGQGQPTFSFASSTDTGMYLSAPAQLSFAAAGTSALTIFANGNVGASSNISAYQHNDADLMIGAINPMAGRAALLQASAQSPYVATQLVSTVGGTTTSWIAGMFGLDAYSIGAGGKYSVVIDKAAPSGSLYLGPSGSVGIGTNVPLAPLDVRGPAGASEVATIYRPTSTLYDGAGLGIYQDNASSNRVRTGLIDTIILDNSPGAERSAMRFFVNQAGAQTEVMRFAGYGNVGIGTNAPVAGVVLDVSGAGPGLSAMTVPRDSTANRPSTGVNGMLRYNTSSNAFEGFANGAWSAFSAVGGAGAVSSVTSGAGLLGGTITSSGTLSVDVGNAAGKIVQENGNAQIAQGLGSETLPSFSFATNTGAGMYSPNADTLAFSVHGTSNLMIGYGGVGIGTNYPGAKLDVSGNSASPLVSAINQFGSGFAIQQINASGGGVPLLQMNQQRSGNAATQAGDMIGAVSSQGYNGSTYVGGGNVSFYAEQNFSGASAPTSLVIGTTPASGGAINRVIVTGQGNVGIGTMNPQGILDLYATGTSSAMLLPRDSAANRPAGVNGMLRYNNTADVIEGFVGGVWATLQSGAPPTLNTGTGANQIVQLNAQAQTALSAGSAAAPTYAFGASPGTGVYSPLADQLGLVTNGTERMRVGYGGHFAIGDDLTQTNGTLFDSLDYRLDDPSGWSSSNYHQTTYEPASGVGGSAQIVNSYMTSEFRGGSTALQMIASISDATNASSGNLSQLVGSVGAIFQNSGTTSDAVSFEAAVNGNGGTLNAYTGFRVSTHIASGFTLPTAIGVDITDLNATSAYGIYQEGADDQNAFMGRVGIGTNSPGAALDVSGHVANSGVGVPTVSSCGTSPPAVVGNDTRGRFQYGTGTATKTCTITFATPYATAPFCTVNQYGGVNAGAVAVTSTSTTTMVVQWVTAAASVKFNYNCLQ